jgi:type I restriction enzyme S subunit
LTLFISSKKDYIKETCRGTTVPHVSPDAISNMELAIPPLPEQKRIVDLISSVDSYIEALEKQAESARKSRSAVLHEILSAGGDGWTKTTLGEIAEIYQPQTIAKSLMDDSAKYIVYGANGPIGRYHEFNHAESEVVVTCRGATCGTVNMTPEETWITGNAMVVHPKSDLLDKQFLYYSLTSVVDVHSIISGSAQPQITREGMMPVKISIPPLSEQKRIVDLISSMDDGISATEKLISDTKQLRSGLLSDLLSGEHEIPQNYDKVMGAP